MNIDEAKDFFENKDKEIVEQICYILRGYENVILHHVSDFVASICGVDRTQMLSNCDKIPLAQARWLYWYAIRYMTNDTYDKIADRTALQGHHFASSSIGLCINKMARLIESEPIWKKRWYIVKPILRMWMEKHAGTSHNEETKVVISCPKDCNIKFDIKKE